MWNLQDVRLLRKNIVTIKIWIIFICCWPKMRKVFFVPKYITCLSDCNRTQTHKHLVCKRTLNYLAKLAKWFSYVVRTYLYRAFDCMLLSCHVRVSEWIHTLYLSECQGTPCSKQAWHLKFKWLQRNSNPQPLSS